MHPRLRSRSKPILLPLRFNIVETHSLIHLLTYLLTHLLTYILIDAKEKQRDGKINRITNLPFGSSCFLSRIRKEKRILYEHPVFCGVTRVHAPRRSPVYMNKRTQARRQWTEHYSALQETSAWCIDRGWPHVIEWVTSHAFQHESYVTLGCILQDASTKISPPPLLTLLFFFFSPTLPLPLCFEFETRFLRRKEARIRIQFLNSRKSRSGEKEESCVTDVWQR